MTLGPELWEWNRSVPWEYFSSAFLEGKLKQECKSQIEKIHHSRSTIFFGFAFVEAATNISIIKNMFGGDGEQAKKIVRYKKINDKIELLAHHFNDEKITKIFNAIADDVKSLRNEITHPKRQDATVQFLALNLKVKEFCQNLARFIVHVHDLGNEHFRYWVTGWNYTGLNGNYHELTFLNNANAFMYSLSNLGFKFAPMYGPGSLSAEDKYMRGLEPYETLIEFLEKCPTDVEPFQPRFPARPRLLKRWWDPNVTKQLERDYLDQIKLHRK